MFSFWCMNSWLDRLKLTSCTVLQYYEVHIKFSRFFFIFSAKYSRKRAPLCCRKGTRDRFRAELRVESVTRFERPSSNYVHFYCVTVYLHSPVPTQHGRFDLQTQNLLLHHRVAGMMSKRLVTNLPAS